MEKDCIFCRIINKEIPAQIVFETQDLVAFKDINPKAKIHILIVPKEHILNVEEIGLEEKELLCKMIFAAKEIAKNYEESRSGYKLIFNVKESGGQIVPHIHMHLLAGENIQLP
ncbi:MAG TPA: histidine triad nucleotide-binding protein [Candidatus Pacearchaeota archaeon]|nr:histidine triad nucleotide-binding protein [Candidatus Parcubacteria bacterium]HNZ83881.1 histidine triad nucleotide-binding protein [Candidatus Pacearchaeota archaeon]HOU45559.1 histidine triad nucleotide-binding protein [Candidatus Pacearchaeota archaeon]HPM08422.1 histidine triad nucleotide-binding protein [Candidatus Pacearchaeota archaeon]HQI74284.1 histidine triad nucleotide-binding protein [Candidatus Pacearchaeota archaeon]